MGDTLFVCTTCKRGPDEKPLGPDFIATLEKARLPVGMNVVGTACMTNCSRPLSVALAGLGKATYMLAEIDPITDIEPLIDLSQLYAQRADGQTKLLERPKALRRKIIARVPGVVQVER